MSNVYLGSMSAPSRPGMSRYEFTDSNGYRVGPVIEASNPAEARARVESMTGQRPAHCTHLSDYHSLAPAAAMPDPEDYYHHLFEQDS